ncbi:MAG: amidohydrolase family protein [Burkholderiaceae bacterium]|nr:amidohydrolase family protein [Burkholderiaceae bacterium]
MTSHSTQSPAQIRASLKHPIVDGDGHWMETPAVLAEYLCDVAGPAITDKYLASQKEDLRWYQASDAERMQKRYRRQNWWSFPSTTLDSATFRLPKLLHERLPEMGIDFSVVYPTLGLFLEGLADTEVRLAACRAYNTMVADLFKPYADRLAPVAIVPRLTPGEAVAEATHAVRKLGLKAIMVSGTMRRPGAKGVPYVEALGLDNQDDYDPMWQACMDLKVAVTSHAGSITWPDRVSVTNYTYNHIGHFAQGNHTFAKAVFLGGVVRRFPKLNFGFLEGGAGWARSLYCDLLGHYEKRNLKSANQHLRPTNTDLPEMARLIDTYATGRLKELRTQMKEAVSGKDGNRLRDETERERDHMDDFAACGVKSKRELREEFSKNFYFGCEADDPMTMTAFEPRLGKPLKALFSSDIAHWDVPDVLDVVPEVYEMLEHGLLDEKAFRDFVFGNVVRLHGGMNPNFFDGTVVQEQARTELAGAASALAA